MGANEPIQNVTSTPAPSAMESTDTMGADVPTVGLNGTLETMPPELTSIADIEAQADAQRVEEGLPILDDVEGLPVYTGPDVWGGIRQTFQNGNFSLDGFMDGLRSSGEAALYGLGEGAENTLENSSVLAEESGKWLIRAVLRTTGAPSELTDQLDGTTDDPEFEASQRAQFEEAIPNIAKLLGVPEPDSTLDNVVAAVTPLVASYITGTKLLEGLGVAAKMSQLELGSGVVAQGLARMGITGSRAGKGALEILKAGSSTGLVFERDSENYADMLKGFSNREDNIGKLSRAWLKVPFVEALAKDEDDSELEKLMKNSLDAAYGEVGGLLTYVMLRNSKVIAQATGRGVKKGAVKLSNAVFKKSATEQELMEQAIVKLSNDTNNIAALDDIYGPQQATAPLRKEPGEALKGSVKVTDEVVEETVEETLDTALPTAADAVTDKSVFTSKGVAGKLQEFLAWSPEETIARIKKAKEVSIQADEEMLLGKQRYRDFTSRVDDHMTRESFNSDGYLKHITDASNSDDPAAFREALEEWEGFVKNNDPSRLLTPQQIAKFDNTPMNVTHNIVDAVKHLTTNNPRRLAEAEKFLVRLMGDPLNKTSKKIAKRLLSDGAEAASGIDKAARVQLTNRVYVTNKALPDLERALNVLKEKPDNEQMQRVALNILGEINQYKKADDLIGSAAGRLLQGRQIDPEVASKLQQIYGPSEYRNMFDPLGKPLPGEELVEEVLPQVADGAITQAEKAQLDMLKRYWGAIEPGAKDSWANSIFEMGQHPLWKRLGQTVNFTSELAENLLMSAVLFHPSTWSRVFQSSILGTVYDSAAQAMARGTALGPKTQKVMQFGAMWRAFSLPYSILVGGKSFLRPKWQDVYSLGPQLYKRGPMLGPEAFTRSFGPDVAAKVFTAGGGVPGMFLKGAGLGMGIPHHVLGSFETMINQGALSSRAAEVLFSGAIDKGMSTKQATNFVFKNISDVMQDITVAHHAPSGSIELKNVVGLDIEHLRDMARTVDDNAAYTSLREKGLEALSKRATTKIGDTIPFRFARSVSEGLQGIPVVGPALRGTLAPFTKVSANMLSRSITPAQAALDFASRAILGKGGPSDYISEVMQGLHGANRQAQMQGHALLATALGWLGVANMAHLRDTGKDTPYALGRSAQMEAANERGVRYFEVPLPDGGSLTIGGLNPFVTPYAIGNYWEWIRSEYGARAFNPFDSNPDAQEGNKHASQLFQVAAPFAPMYQGLADVFGSLDADDGEGGFDSIGSVLAGLSASAGNMLERPLRIPDLLPGQQVASKSKTVTNAGIRTAFETAMGGRQSGPNIFRVNAYNRFGETIPDKYDPDNQTNQFLESVGYPTYKERDESAFGQYLAELESHGITLPRTPKKLNIAFGGELESISVPLQLFFNEETGEHLWDVYNRMFRETKTTSWLERTVSTETMTVREATEEYAKSILSEERGEGRSRVSRVGASRIKALNASTDKLQVHMAVAWDDARNDLETYLLEHAGDFVDAEGRPLTDYVERMYQAGQTAVPSKEELEIQE